MNTVVITPLEVKHSVMFKRWQGLLAKAYRLEMLGFASSSTTDALK